MARQEQYEHQHKTLIRAEIAGESVVVSETHMISWYRGKSWPTVCVRWKGRHILRLGAKVVITTDSVISDAGPIVGISLSFTHLMETSPTQEQYEHQNTTLIREEIAGESVVVSEKHRVTPYRGKDWPTVCIRWKGLHMLRLGDQEILAAESVISDAGPKVGVSLTFERPREAPPTQEEIQHNRENINRVLRSICGCEVTDWGDGKGEKRNVVQTKNGPPLAV